MKTIQPRVIIICLLALAGGLTACDFNTHTAETPLTETITVEKAPVRTPLNFQGHVAPLQSETVSSPVEGTLKKVFVKSGQAVQAGDPLLQLESSQLQQNVQEKLYAYVKAAQDYNNRALEWENTQSLNQHGLIAKTEFTNTKQQFQNSLINKMQTQADLARLLDKVGKKINFDALKIDDVEKLRDTLTANMDTLTLSAPQAGIVLLPEDATFSSMEAFKLGRAIKKDDPLLMIGNMQGIAINIEVNETNIKDVHLDQTVAVQLSAYPQGRLKGRITEIDTQSHNTQKQLPRYPVQVSVDSLPEALAPKILVGMRAKVTMMITHPPTIMIPLNAITLKDEQPYVTRRNAEGVTELVPIQTGMTTLNTVQVLANLNPGDTLVIPN